MTHHGEVDRMTADVQWPILKPGSKSVDVTALQYMLRAADGTALTADGVFGPATEQAVVTFQSRVRLTADGIVGALTWGKLTDGSTVPSTVGPGGQGDFVRAAQTELLKHDDLDSTADVDGIFGPKTETATKAFQKTVGLGVDGIVGPLTWKQLISLPGA
jgi:peptidoglycan hydrolase-like protein with peptidoglycan-binding domain